MNRENHKYIGVPGDCPYDDEVCPNCGYGFDDSEWDYTHAGDAWGGTASYFCPECEEQSVTVNY